MQETGYSLAPSPPLVLLLHARSLVLAGCRRKQKKAEHRPPARQLTTLARCMLQGSAGDGVHSVTYVKGDKPEERGYFDRVENFDYDSVDRSLGFEPEEERVSWSDASAAISLILSWACGRGDSCRAKPPSITSAGARIHALLYLLDPVNARYDSLDAIAIESGMTRQGVSKALMDLRRELGGILPMKVSGSSDVYRKAQEAALAAGCHSSVTRKDLLSKREAT
jgi:hypothetical protein